MKHEALHPPTKKTFFMLGRFVLLLFGEWSYPKDCKNLICSPHSQLSRYCVMLAKAGRHLLLLHHPPTLAAAADQGTLSGPIFFLVLKQEK